MGEYNKDLNVRCPRESSVEVLKRQLEMHMAGDAGGGVGGRGLNNRPLSLRSHMSRGPSRMLREQGSREQRPVVDCPAQPVGLGIAGGTQPCCPVSVCQACGTADPNTCHLAISSEK